VFLMLSNHYPQVFGAGHAWAVVAIALLLGAAVRHWFNTYEAGGSGWRLAWQWPAAVVLALGLTATARPAAGPAAAAARNAHPLDAAAFEIVERRCTVCHAAAPTYPGLAAPPKGVALETAEAMRLHEAQIVAQAVTTRAMPLANATAMTEGERAVLAAWAER
jgi:uncharacterized membrane protein